MNLTRSTLCVYRDVFTATWNSGQNYCYGIFSGASLCTHEQLRRACRNGSFTLATGTWMADRAGDNSVLFVNGTNCDDFDGVSSATVSQPASYCCLEWMKY